MPGREKSWIQTQNFPLATLPLAYGLQGRFLGHQEMGQLALQTPGIRYQCKGASLKVNASHILNTQEARRLLSQATMLLVGTGGALESLVD